MKKNIVLGLMLILSMTCFFMAGASEQAAVKPSPDEIIAQLKAGNERFVAGKSTDPHSDMNRVKLAGAESQAKHALATILSCSDSRVPVELIFDVGVMDVFVVRVAGNVCNTDEAGSIEYGLAHVNTPLLVVLGHSQCGAVTAVNLAIQGKGHALERNIPPLVDSIQPAVKRAIERHPEAHEDAIVPFAIEENVSQSIHNLFMASPAVRDIVKSGKAKVVGAIYDVGAGTVKWLDEAKTDKILAEVEKDPARAMDAMAGGGHEGGGGKEEKKH